MIFSLVVEDVVFDYLSKKDTDYAVLINGVWGSGKTYFWKNKLSERIEEELDYKTIYISLNGISALDEIDRSLFFSAYKFKEKLDIEKIGLKENSLFSNLISGGMTLLGGADAIEKVDLQNFIDLNKTVICFDDLERCYMPIEKILGYINNFVEHDNIKTVIIANENEINGVKFSENNSFKEELAFKFITASEKEAEIKEKFETALKFINENYSYYSNIKEKLIGKTVNFSPGESYYDSVIDDFIERYEEEYKKYLFKVKEVILQIFLESGKKLDKEPEKKEKGNKNRNLRILKHALDDFNKIFDGIQKYDNEKLTESLFIYFVALSFEYKLSEISRDEMLKINADHHIRERTFHEGRKNISLKFVQKYYIGKNNLFFESFISIVNYIKSGYLDKKLLEKEINDKIPLEKESSQVYKIFNNWWNIKDDKTFYEVTDELIADIKNGDIDFELYKHTFTRLLFFVEKGALSITAEDLLDKFKNGAKKSVKKTDTLARHQKPGIKSELNRLSSKNRELVKKLNDFTKEVKEEEKERRLQKKLEKLINNLFNDQDEFFEKIYNHLDEYGIRPVMDYLDIDRIISDFDQLDNNIILELRNIIDRRYNYSNVSEYLASDLDGLEKLKTGLESYIDENIEDNGLRKIIVQFLIEDIEDICHKLRN